MVSAIFHYLGPAFAVLLFARVDALGVAWLRIASAAVIFAAWRRPWRVWRSLDRATRWLLAGWAAVLARLSAQEEVVIGTPTANRGRREIEGLIGFFVNTLVLRVDLSDAPTVAELLARVKQRALAAQHHQDIPFEQVVELVDPARSLSHHCLLYTSPSPRPPACGRGAPAGPPTGSAR